MAPVPSSVALVPSSERSKKTNSSGVSDPQSCTAHLDGRPPTRGAKPTLEGLLGFENSPHPPLGGQKSPVPLPGLVQASFVGRVARVADDLEAED